LERAALDVVSRHKDWAGGFVSRLGQWLADPQLPAERRAALHGVLAAFAGDAEVQRLVADTLARPDAPPATRALLLEVLGQVAIKPWPKAFNAPLRAALQSPDNAQAGLAVAVVAAHHLHTFDAQLHHLAADESRPSAVRVAATTAAVAGGRPLPGDVFPLLVEQCRAKVSPVERLAAARALADATLTADQQRQVAGLLAKADPLVLPVLADALEKGGDAATGAAIVASLSQSPGLGNLSTARVGRLLAKYPPEVRQSAEPLVAQLRAKSEGQLERLTELSKLVATGGEARKGRQVFRDPRALCMSCHRIGTEGEGIGPDLSNIGATRTRADLLESIVLPSASFVQGFEPYTVATTGGRVFSGIISRQTSEAVYLRLADRSEVRIPRSEIESLEPGKESIMPNGLDRVLTVEELRDLLAYLSSLGVPSK
jgi:putative heme-binding domain-containing protein